MSTQAEHTRMIQLTVIEEDTRTALPRITINPEIYGGKPDRSWIAVFRYPTCWDSLLLAKRRSQSCSPTLTLSERTF